MLDVLFDAQARRAVGRALALTWTALYHVRRHGQDARRGMAVERLAARLAQIPGVIAVTLGGSRASGRHRPDSDWDFGLYYRGSIDTAVIRAMGYPGTVSEPGEWAYPMNGGAWLTVEGQKVDLLYRDLDDVDRWTEESVRGRFDLFRVPGYLCGMPSYVLTGEVASGRVLEGALVQPNFPEKLAERGPGKWMWEAGFALLHARSHASRGAVAACLGMCAFAVVAVAHARLLRAREWALNEKDTVRRAGLGDVEAMLTSGKNLVDLVERVDAELEVRS